METTHGATKNKSLVMRLLINKIVVMLELNNQTAKLLDVVGNQLKVKVNHGVIIKQHLEDNVPNSIGQLQVQDSQAHLKIK